jgi:hypothetical protein
MFRGLLWFFGGCLVTAFTYISAAKSPYGGSYVVAYGAIIYGAIQFVRGKQYATGTVDPNTAADQMLDIAATYESIDKPKALALYAEIIKNYPTSRAANEATQNIKTLNTHSPPPL